MNIETQNGEEIAAPIIGTVFRLLKDRRGFDVIRLGNFHQKIVKILVKITIQ